MLYDSYKLLWIPVVWGCITQQKGFAESSSVSLSYVFFFYLQIAVDCIHISLHVFVPRLRPVRIDSNGDEATLCCSVLVIVEVPGLSVGLDQVVSCDIMLSRDA